MSTEAAPAARATRSQTAPNPEAKAEIIRRLHQYAEFTQLPFMCVDVASGAVQAVSQENLLPVVPTVILEMLRRSPAVHVTEFENGLIFYALPLPSLGGRPMAALGYALNHPDARPDDLFLEAASRNWTRPQLTAFLDQLPHGQARTFKSLLEILVGNLHRDLYHFELVRQLEVFGSELRKAYAEICLLHSVAANLQITRSPKEFAGLCLRQLYQLVSDGGFAIRLGNDSDSDGLYLSEGVLPFDRAGFQRLIARIVSKKSASPLIMDNLAGTQIGIDFPGLDNLILAPIVQGKQRQGWLLSCNQLDVKGGSVQVSLITSLAGILGTHLRNLQLYHHNADLMVDFIRSLVSTLDAKDPHTRGHSERVAMISFCLAETLGLAEDDLHAVYLSGLLHDIGKLGIDDRVLQKRGPLSEDEIQHVGKHPIIGYEILKNIRQLHDVLPGVRHHHERFGGGGYPDGLIGDDIPIMARIIAVADSYDAMTSDRPYRDGMPLQALEAIFRDGRGTQWDPAVIDAYFRIRDKVRKICQSETSSGLLEPAEEPRQKA